MVKRFVTRPNIWGKPTHPFAALQLRLLAAQEAQLADAHATADREAVELTAARRDSKEQRALVRFCLQKHMSPSFSSGIGLRRHF